MSTELPWRDALRREAAAGQEVLVGTDAYGVRGEHWCRILWIAAGTASLYPVKVQIPGKGTGQYSGGEILGWRSPTGNTR